MSHTRHAVAISKTPTKNPRPEARSLDDLRFEAATAGCRAPKKRVFAFCLRRNPPQPPHALLGGGLEAGGTTAWQAGREMTAERIAQKQTKATSGPSRLHFTGDHAPSWLMLVYGRGGGGGLAIRWGVSGAGRDHHNYTSSTTYYHTTTTAAATAVLYLGRLPWAFLFAPKASPVASS
jgi:hypothetical protein